MSRIQTTCTLCLRPKTARSNRRALPRIGLFLALGGACLSSVLRAQEAAKPLTLEAGIFEALHQSQQAKVARSARNASQLQTDRDKPTARPTVEATASGTTQGPRVTFPRPDGTNAVVLPEEVGRVDLVVEQPLYHAGQRAAKQRYTAESSVVELDYRKALADLALTVRKAYLDMLRAESGVHTAQEGVDAAQSYRDLVRGQIAAGQAKPVDLQTAEAQVAEAQAGLTQAEGGRTLARLALNRALGRPLTAPLTLASPPPTPTVPDSPDAAVTHALQNRIEIIELQQNLSAAKAGVSLARSQMQPTVSARGQITEQTPSAFIHEHYAAATVELHWSLLDAGKTRQDTQEAKATAQRLEDLLEETRQGIALDVIQAWQKMRDARDRIALAQTQRRGAEATDTVAEEAYKVGRSTAVEVQGAQREVRLARERELQAIYDLQTAAADFDAAQGITSSALDALAPLPSGKAR